MEVFLELFKYTIPSLVVFITTFFLVKWFLKNEAERRRHEFLLTKHKDILPTRLAAYERITLFLERINTESLVIREQSNVNNCKQFQAHLLTIIRTEFEHNVAMQVYVTPQTWSLVKKAKEEIVRLVNICSGLVKPEDPAIALGKTMIEQHNSETAYHVNKALDALKNDVQTFYS
jgi:hypothetical protein